jgi:hypothetical protein
MPDSSLTWNNMTHLTRGLTLELRGGADNLETTQVSRMKAVLFAVPSSDLFGGGITKAL